MNRKKTKANFLTTTNKLYSDIFKLGNIIIICIKLKKMV